MKFYVKWHTKPGMGHAYYSGVRSIDADDMDAASEVAQRNIHREAFQDLYLSDIVIDGVSTNAPTSRRYEDED